MKYNLPFGRKAIMMTAVILAVWIAAAWYISSSQYDSRVREVVRNEIEQIQDDEEDIVYNVSWNLKYLHGIPRSLAGEESIRKALAAFGPDAVSTSLPKEVQKRKWEEDASLARLSQWLSMAVKGLGPDVMWVVNAAGDCIAASNGGEKTSFVGTNYADRDYFRLPRQGKDGMQYAFGRVTNKAGLFFSSPVMIDNRFAGLVAIKIDVERLSFWVKHVNAFLTDANGVVILAFDKSLEMRALGDAAVFGFPADKRKACYKRDTFPVLQIQPWGDRRLKSLVKFNNKKNPFAMNVKKVSEEGLTIFATHEIPALQKLDQERQSYFILLAIIGISLILLAGLVLYLIGMRLTNARVAASELRYRTLFESSRDAITTLSPADQRFLSGNPAAIAMFKAGDEATFTAKTPWDFSPEFQPDGQSSKEIVKKQIETTVREGIMSFEWMHKRMDGELFPAAVLLTSFQINDQTIIQSTVRDITERKKVEDRLVKDAQELENINRQLLENQSRLIQSEKLAAIGQLAAGVAHEINNPVGFVTSNSATLSTYIHAIKEIIRMAEEGKSPAEIAVKKKELKLDFILEDIDSLLFENREGLSRIADIVKNLKNFAHQEKDNVCIEADLNAGIKSALVVARNEIKYHADVKLELGDIRQVFCRIGEINQVVLNLLVNSAQAIGGQDRKGMGKGLITVRTYERGDFVYCEIQDDGPGIPLEFQKRMFEPFFTTKEKGKGTGLGLSISQDIIVKRHHGDLSFKSEPGKGCTFFIRLPIDGRGPAPTPDGGCA